MMTFHLNTKAQIALIAFAFLLFSGALLRAKGAPAKPAMAAEIHIDNFSFQQPTITVPVGTEVTWINRDDIPHTVVSENQVFKSRALDTDEKFSFTFTQPGTYKYFCSIHPKMTAEVVVK
jgi:plastocyanin